MPTRNRRAFVGQAIAYFLRQDYDSKELIIVDDGEDGIEDLVTQDRQIRYIRLAKKTPVGAKRNLACEHSRGEFIAHWDDDDWMARDRISHQLNALIASGKDVIGTAKLLHYRLRAGEVWRYCYPSSPPRPWVAGGTLLYRRSLWEAHPFPAINVGEDTAFIDQCSPEQILVSPFTDYVAILHGANTAAKNLVDPRWSPYPLNDLVNLLGQDLLFYIKLRQRQAIQSSISHRSSHSTQPAALAVPQTLPDQRNFRSRLTVSPSSATSPLVTCIMPTFNRHRFVPQAIAYFQRQTYPNCELLIIDDGDQSMINLLPSDPAIHVLRSSRRLSIGTKRNLACEAAQGELILLWDDDDWYGAERIAYQVTPLLAGKADLTALGNSPMLALGERQFWRCTTQVYDQMFVRGVTGGTLAFRKSIWQAGTRFPDISLAEDAAFLEAAIGRGAKLVSLPNGGVFYYVRHPTNSWQFQVGEFRDCRGWQRIPPPSFIPAGDLAFYGFDPIEASSVTGRSKSESRSPQTPLQPLAQNPASTTVSAIT